MICETEPVHANFPHISYCTNPEAQCSFLLLHTYGLFLFRFLSVCAVVTFPSAVSCTSIRREGWIGLADENPTRGIIPRHSRRTGFAGGSAHLAGDPWLPRFVFFIGIACQGGATGSRSCISVYFGGEISYRVVSTFRWSLFLFSLILYPRYTLSGS